jgi:hypothetical protein
MDRHKIKRCKAWAFGPPGPREILFRSPVRFLLPTLFLGAAAIILVVSTFLPYWHMELDAPQYPRGLDLTVYVDHVEGDVGEVDGLNHYIGMRPLSEAGELERSMSVIAIVVVAGLVFSSVFVHSPCALILSWPAIAYPGIFLLDLWFWMRKFGHDLDPLAPLSNIIESFTPPIIGHGEIAQFKTNAIWEEGLLLAFAASICVVIGIILHRRAYKPLREEVLRALEAEPAGADG